MVPCSVRVWAEVFSQCLCICVSITGCDHPLPRCVYIPCRVCLRVQGSQCVHICVAVCACVVTVCVYPLYLAWLDSLCLGVSGSFSWSVLFCTNDNGTEVILVTRNASTKGPAGETERQLVKLVKGNNILPVTIILWNSMPQDIEARRSLRSTFLVSMIISFPFPNT